MSVIFNEKTLGDIIAIEFIKKTFETGSFDFFSIRKLNIIIWNIKCSFQHSFVALSKYVWVGIK